MPSYLPRWLHSLLPKGQTEPEPEPTVPRRKKERRFSWVMPGVLESQAPPLTIEQGVQDAFCAFDTDNDGRISLDELKAALKRPGTTGGKPLSTEELQVILKEFDDGDGALTVDEFIKMMVGAGLDPAAPYSSLRPYSSGGLMDAFKFISRMKKTRETTTSDEPKGRSPREPKRGPKPSSSKRAPGSLMKKSSSSKKLNSGDALDAKLAMLRPIRALEEEVEQHEAEAAALEGRAAKSGVLSFERRMGQRLIDLNVSSREEMAELVRTWDTSKDGFISPAEFRHVVRQVLKVASDNHEVDRLFAAYDANGSGKLDLAELKPCLLALQAAVRTAAAEEADLLKRAAAKRERAALPREAARAMAELAKARARLDAHRGSQPMNVKLASLLYQRSIPTNDCVAQWAGKIGCEAGKIVSEKDKAAAQTVGKDGFRQGVLRLFEKCGTSAAAEGVLPDEIDAYFHAKADLGRAMSLNLKHFLWTSHQAATEARKEEALIVDEIASVAQMAQRSQAKLDTVREQEAEAQEAAAAQCESRRVQTLAAEAASEAARLVMAAAAAERKAKARVEWEAKVDEKREVDSLFGAAARGVKPVDNANRGSFKSRASAGEGKAGASKPEGAVSVAEHAPVSTDQEATVQVGDGGRRQQADAASGRSGEEPVAAAKALKLEVLMVRTKLKVRASFELDSEHTNDLAAGVKVHVLQRQALPDGQVRTQIALKGQPEPHGWVSWLGKDGRENLVVPMVVHDEVTVQVT